MNMPQPLRQRTKTYALDIIRPVEKLPTTMVAQTLGKQLLRSGTSVGANYREASRGRSDAELIAKFGVCIQELDESGYWMELLSDAGIVPETALTSLLDKTDQLIAIFVTSAKRASKNQRHP